MNHLIKLQHKMCPNNDHLQVSSEIPMKIKTLKITHHFLEFPFTKALTSFIVFIFSLVESNIKYVLKSDEIASHSLAYAVTVETNLSDSLA